MSILFLDRNNPDLPDVTDGIPCCMGHAMNGPGGCTCWVAIYDQEQQRPKQGKLIERKSSCHDCAYRTGSPERTGAEGYSGNEEELMELVYSGEPFWCHQGMRRIVSYRHPNGTLIQAHPSEYAPASITLAGKPVALKADGTPADLCGGWCARRKALALEGAPA